MLCADGQAGLDLIKKVKPDLIILDLIMPGIDGYDLARAVRADPRTATTPIILQTAHYLEPEIRRIAEQIGIQQVIIKPFEPQAFLDVVAKALLDGAVVPLSSQAALGSEFHVEHLRVVAAKLYEKVYGARGYARRAGKNGGQVPGPLQGPARGCLGLRPGDFAFCRGERRGGKAVRLLARRFSRDDDQGSQCPGRRAGITGNPSRGAIGSAAPSQEGRDGDGGPDLDPGCLLWPEISLRHGADGDRETCHGTTGAPTRADRNRKAGCYFIVQRAFSVSQPIRNIPSLRTIFTMFDCFFHLELPSTRKNSSRTWSRTCGYLVSI